MPIQSHVGEGSKGFIVLLFLICETDRSNCDEEHLEVVNLHTLMKKPMIMMGLSL